MIQASVQSIQLAADDMAGTPASQSMTTAAATIGRCLREIEFILNNLTVIGTITGSKGGNVALANLITAMQTAGECTDQTT